MFLIIRILNNDAQLKSTGYHFINLSEITHLWNNLIWLNISWKGCDNSLRLDMDCIKDECGEFFSGDNSPDNINKVNNFMYNLSRQIKQNKNCEIIYDMGKYCQKSLDRVNDYVKEYFDEKEN